MKVMSPEGIARGGGRSAGREDVKTAMMTMTRARTWQHEADEAGDEERPTDEEEKHLELEVEEVDG